ncbi:hypothetical protein B0H10DRAFT_2442367, partial [Mycena sp. CBHHK59/15]
MSLGWLGLSSLAHLQLRVQVKGGTSSPRMHTPEASLSRPSGAGLDSPAKNTRGQTKKRAAALDDDSDTPVIISPKKKRPKASTEDNSDEAVWNKTDSRKAWMSSAYDHYTISLEQTFSGPQQDKPGVLTFIFTCHHDPLVHKAQKRKRMQSSQGTAAFQETAIRMHSKIFTDPCPATPLPAIMLYLAGSKMGKEYFKDYHSTIHAIIDGWTAPFVASYLGIVIVWFAAGKIHHAILEFIRLTESHTGTYLA